MSVVCSKSPMGGLILLVIQGWVIDMSLDFYQRD